MKEICVAYKQVNKSEGGPVNITYSLDKVENTVVLNCMVVSCYPEASVWLRTRKFNMKAMLQGKKYSAVFDNSSFDLSLEMTLFIDTAFASIMKQEKLPLATA